PVSFYYCWNLTDTVVEFVVAEVHNTPWGERHCYVLDLRARHRTKQQQKIEFEKAFHVSPFMGMDQLYRWWLSTPGETLSVTMESRDQGKRVFSAAMELKRKAIDHTSLARILTVYPFMTFKVIFAIYYQALCLRLKKMPFYRHPKYCRAGELGS
ncbi:MAG: DUF1365 domain-containing protein, partial [Gammaproteobacteria bacterium]|nr:DUF1365 domain-containing protein [Gammaproteobacteria bacterium]